MYLQNWKLTNRGELFNVQRMKVYNWVYHRKLPVIPPRNSRSDPVATGQVIDKFTREQLILLVHPAEGLCTSAC